MGTRSCRMLSRSRMVTELLRVFQVLDIGT